MYTDKSIAASIGIISSRLQTQLFLLPIDFYIFFSGTAHPAWSVLQSNCVLVDQPQKGVSKGHVCDQIVQRLIELQVMY